MTLSLAACSRALPGSWGDEGPVGLCLQPDDLTLFACASSDILVGLGNPRCAHSEYCQSLQGFVFVRRVGDC